MSNIQYFALTPVVAAKPTGLLRLTRTPEDLTLESFDQKTQTWIENPKAIDYLNGNDNDAQEVSQAQAMQILSSLK